MNKNHFLSLVFNQPRCHGNSTHPSQNARINTSVINLDSCKKQAPKDKEFKSYGELCIGTLKLCSATLNRKTIGTLGQMAITHLYNSYTHKVKQT